MQESKTNAIFLPNVLYYKDFRHITGSTSSALMLSFIFRSCETQGFEPVMLSDSDICDALNMSLQSVVAAKRRIVASGCVIVSRKRKTIYEINMGLMYDKIKEIRK